MAQLREEKEEEDLLLIAREAEKVKPLELQREMKYVLLMCC